MTAVLTLAGCGQAGTAPGAGSAAASGATANMCAGAVTAATTSRVAPSVPCMTPQGAQVLLQQERSQYTAMVRAGTALPAVRSAWDLFQPTWAAFQKKLDAKLGGNGGFPLLPAAEVVQADLICAAADLTALDGAYQSIYQTGGVSAPDRQKVAASKAAFGVDAGPQADRDVTAWTAGTSASPPQQCPSAGLSSSSSG